MKPSAGRDRKISSAAATTSRSWRTRSLWFRNLMCHRLPICRRREPYAQFMSTRRRARELEVRDVRAGDEQHEGDDDEDRQERSLVPLTES